MIAGCNPCALFSLMCSFSPADVDLAYDILYAVSPQTAQGLKPVRMACEDNGIRMEVIAADFRDNKAQILSVCRTWLVIELMRQLISLTATINQPFLVMQPATCRF